MITVGTACYDDFNGVYFTLLGLRMYNDVRDVELVVVDNHPDSAHGEHVRGLTHWMEDAASRGSLGGYQYIPLPSPVGTSAPRDEVFRRARGEFVLCVDSHVLLAQGALAKLGSAVRAGTFSDGHLVCGPMLYDGLATTSTHFDDVWRDQMWGTWASAWRCACGEQLYSAREEAGAVALYELKVRAERLRSCPACGRAAPEGVPWPGHERALLASRMTLASEGIAPFEVPMQGLGLFGCTKDAWLGFSPAFRGFGGEEGYIHEKYRQAGRRTVCYPWLRWAHRFGRPEGAKYPLNVWNKVRNYTIGLRELRLPHTPLRTLFSHLVPDREWRVLDQDPVPEWPPGEARAVAQSPEGLYAGLLGTKHDFAGHEGLLRGLAERSVAVTELGGRRRSSTVCLLAGLQRPGASLRLVDPDDGFGELQRSAGLCRMAHNPVASLEAVPEPCDLLLIDTKHTEDQLHAELSRWGSSAARIAVHDTTLHAVHGEGGGRGLLFAVRRWLKEPWFVAVHDGRGYGLTVLSRDPADRPAQEIRLWHGAAPDDPAKGGPGTELKLLLSSLGAEPSASCECNSRMAQMDAWGAEGCADNRNTILGWLRDGYVKWGWKDKLAAAARAVRTGVAFRINPLDPFPGLLDEAVRRAGKG